MPKANKPLVHPARAAKSMYVGPSVIREQHSRLYLFDAGTGEIIAELSVEAATAVRSAKVGPVRLTYNGTAENVQVEA